MRVVIDLEKMMVVLVLVVTGIASVVKVMTVAVMSPMSLLSVMCRVVLCWNGMSVMHYRNSVTSL